MAVDPLEERRLRVFNALSPDASRTWSFGNGQNRVEITVSNPQLRELLGFRIFSVDITVTRGGVLYYRDRMNLPNPVVGVRGNGGAVTDNPLAAVRQQLLDSINAATRGLTIVHDMGNGLGGFIGDTLSVRSSTDDAFVESGPHGNVNTCMGGTGLSADTTDTNIFAQFNLSGGNYQAYESFLPFDTSSLGAGATVSAAALTLYGTGTAESNTDNLTMQARAISFGGTVTTADWKNASALAAGTLCATFSVASWNQTNNTANNFTSDGNFPGQVNLTGLTELVICMNTMLTPTAPTGLNRVAMYSADQTGTTSDPLLTITYTPAATGAMLFMLMGVS